MHCRTLSVGLVFTLVPALAFAQPALRTRTSSSVPDLTTHFRGWAIETEGVWRRDLWRSTEPVPSLLHGLDEPYRGGVIQLSYDLRWLRDDIGFPSSGLTLGLRASATEISPVITGGLLTPILGDVRTEFGAVARYQWNEHELQEIELWLRGQYSFFNWSYSDGTKSAGPAEHRFILEL